MTTTLAAPPTVEPIAERGPWRLREMVLSWDKVGALWDTMKKYETIFSDLTRGDLDNFIQVLTLQNTVWLEVWRGDEEIVGILWVTDLHLTVDATVHCVYFDRQPAEKDEISKAAVQWFFKNFPVRRLSATPPVIYYATIRLLKRIGFKEEGRKRDAVLIGGKWNDQALFGITRPEVEEQ